MPHYRTRLFQIYVILAALAFGALFFLARTTPYFWFDVPFSRAIQSIRGGGFAVGMQWLTDLGYLPLVAVWNVAILLFLLARRLWWEAAMALFGVGGVALVGGAVKDLVARPRPTPDLINVVAAVPETSFPSRHVLIFTAALGFGLFLLYTRAPRSLWRTAGMIGAGVLIALIGVSRVYLGHHWLSDVLGGYLLGSVWLLVTIWVYRWGARKGFLRRSDAGT